MQERHHHWKKEADQWTEQDTGWHGSALLTEFTSSSDQL